jgi:hypothetical protein
MYNLNLEKSRAQRITYNWSSSHELDVDRVLYTILGVAEGFFQRFNFLLLPFAHNSHIYLPDLDYTFMTNLPPHPHEDDVEPDDPDFKEAREKISEQLKTYSYPRRVPIEELRAGFEAIEEQFTASMDYIFPHLYPRVDEVFISVVPFGSVGSFGLHYTDNGSIKLYIYLRNTGMNQKKILSTLIHCLISCPVYELTGVRDVDVARWKTRESVIDFLAEHTVLNLFEPDTTIHELEKEDKALHLLSISDEYYRKLGSHIQGNVIKVENDDIYINGNKIHLHEKEKLVFTLLYSRVNDIVDMDTIESSLYNEDEIEYPGWAIAKIIERLRKKIRKTGIIVPLIYTFRNKGYMMKIQ